MDQAAKSKLASKLVAAGAHLLLREYIAYRKQLERDKLGHATRNIFEDIPRYYAADGGDKALQALDDELSALIREELNDA